MNEQRRVRWHVIFSGRVQHVGFRYTAYYMARELGLTGWVDNLPDGRVEMEVQGPPPKLRKLLDFAGMDRDVADPWYTGDFEATYADVVAGCSALLKEV